jgi:hypothetical protein
MDLITPRSLLILEFTASAMMTGLIWFVQIIHYPLFGRIPGEAFTSYEREHTVRTGWVVAPLMLLELGTALLITLRHLPPGETMLHRSALGALLLIWASTFLIQVPLHGILEKRHDPGAIRLLVATNWIRTLLWTLRTGLLAPLLLAGTI